jgi:hypothetical protein
MMQRLRGSSGASSSSSSRSTNSSSNNSQAAGAGGLAEQLGSWEHPIARQHEVSWWSPVWQPAQHPCLLSFALNHTVFP